MAVNGLIAPNDNVNSTETLTFQGTDQSTDTIDDPGTEEDAPAGDSEGDTETENSDVNGNLTLGDVLDSKETVTAADGTVTKTTIDGNSTDNIVADEQDTALDQHTADLPGAAPETDTDNTKTTDKTSISDTSNGNSTVSLTVSQPVANGTLNTVSTLTSSGNATVTDVSGDQATDNNTTAGPVGQVSNLPVSDNSADINAENISYNASGKTQQNGSGYLVLTDPTTGVKTSLLIDGTTIDNFSGNGTDNTANQTTALVVPPAGGNSTPATSGTGNFTESLNASGNDTITSSGNLTLSITGSPVAGQTENLSQKLTLNGGDKIQSTLTGGGLEQLSVSSSAPPTDNVAGCATVTGTDTGNQTVANTGNSTISIAGSGTNLTTSDALTDKGSLAGGSTSTSTITDTHPLSPAGGGEDDITSNSQLQQALAGGDNSSENVGVAGTTPQGTGVNSSEAIGNQAQLAGTGASGDVGSETVVQSNGAVVSDVESDTATLKDDIKTNSQSTDNLQYQTLGPDPTTGLTDTAKVMDNGTDNGTAERTDAGTDVHNQSSGPTGGSSDTVTFDSKVTQNGNATDSQTIALGAQGTDTQGEQVNAQETVLVNGNATTSGSDEDSGSTGGGTEVVHLDVLAHAGISDSITGTIVAVNSTSGVTTTTTDNALATGTGDEHDHEDETDIRSSGNPDNDTATQTNTTTLALNWNTSENVTQTNADGTVAGTPANTTDSGNDATTAVATLSRGSNGVVVASSSGSDTGADNSSDPTVGNTTWANRPLDPATLASLCGDETMMSDVSTQDANAGGGSGSSGNGGNSGSSGSTGSGSVAPTMPKELIAPLLRDDRPGWIKAGDAVYHFVSDWKLMERSLGGLKALSGLGLVAVGAAGDGAAAGSELVTVGVSTPVSVPLALVSTAVATFGVDLLVSGAQEIVTGNPTETVAAGIVTRATGDPNIGKALDDAGTLAGGMALPSVLASSPSRSVLLGQRGGTAAEANSATVAATAAERAEVGAQEALTAMQGQIQGAHFLTKHSPMMTRTALLERATVGIPNKAGKLIKNDASRFLNYVDMKKAAEKAIAAYKAAGSDGEAVGGV